jgi:D-alanine-D-alanine ligase
MTPMEGKMKVAVLMGGPSLERDISLAAGEACTKALRDEGYDVDPIDVGPDLGLILAEQRPDVAFNALHGRWVEDGCIQGLLEWMRIPYTHSGVLASALAMDKQRSKLAFAAAGVPTAKSIIARQVEIERQHVLKPPYVVKPYNEGSSLGGLFLIETEDARPPVLPDDDREIYMVETYIPGRELTASILGDKKLAVSEFLLSGKLYDYDEKYNSLEHNRILPAKLPQQIYDACLSLALKAHNSLGCRGLSRTDFRWDESRGMDGLVALELNSQPGLRPNSNAGQQAAHVGINFGSLCRWLVEDASLDR